MPTNLALSDVDQVTSALLTNDAWMILDTIGGENKFGTGPVRDSYLALGHTALSRDLNNINGFISKWNYPLFYLKLIEKFMGVVKFSLIILNLLPGKAGDNKVQAGQKPCSMNAASERSTLSVYAVL